MNLTYTVWVHSINFVAKNGIFLFSKKYDSDDQNEFLAAQQYPWTRTRRAAAPTYACGVRIIAGVPKKYRLYID